MNILHILRSEPDAVTAKMMDELSNDRQADVINLYAEDIEWTSVVDSIFAHDRVVCWW